MFGKLCATVSAGVMIGCCAGTALAQGSLTPPPGAPGPSMKTLAQVEPRTPIMNVPYTITQPGSYYLTANLVTTSSGIIISTNDVTVDLMGFSINGDRGTYDYGVFVDGKTNAPCRNIVVRNGTIKNFGNGLGLVNAQHSLFEYLMISGSVSTGILLDGTSGGDCSGNRIANCRVSDGCCGIVLAGAWYGDSAGKCDGNSISDCTFRKNAQEGVYIRVGSGQCNHNEFRNCMIQDNASGGIYAYIANGCYCGNVIERCNISGNNSYGIECTCYEENNTAVGNRISQCTLYGNKSAGIRLYGSAFQVDGNLVSGTQGTSTHGIFISTSWPSLAVQNTCIGHTYNFSVDVTTVTHGPIVTAKGVLSTTNGAAGLSPWANFSR
ncbi:MAG TPA: right-handed parallel beta-helix repeat-containing protein [Kiritimatiellia bacterium]|jgi:parallel beta-helix repeat protein|nr:right-handed parallel beta-helix repeat-containing protein [Kiritimatiellia bacterium]HOR98734.1 right-handed parallel beta-helix repeat-containing protein [Kiritimatiellia bacterium]HRU19851.1 right-handed parallel beta-helix repeat-containing protein [Kiritimatiellia bacterium]